MKEFTDADIQNDHIYLGDHRQDLVHKPLPWQLACRTQTASGYGKKLTSEWVISFNKRLYRVYATCYSNAASHWFRTKGRTVFVSG